MRVADLDLRELLSFDPNGGVIQFAGQRALLLDAVALGLLRSELIRTLGTAAARGILTRFGYAHGWRTAESLKTRFPWDDEERVEARRRATPHAAGPRREHTVDAAARARTPATTRTRFGTTRTRPSSTCSISDESDEPVCWTLTGFASGYTSYAYGRPAYVVEDKCRGKGDAVCRVVGHFREDSGDALTNVLPFYEPGGLDATLGHVTDELKRIEKQLRARKKALGPSARLARRRIRARRARRRDAEGARSRAARREGRHDGARHGRERRRQGAHRASDSRRVDANRRSVRRDQLRGRAREPARVGAVRAREGRVHRRDARPRRAVRGREPRHAVPRRDRRRVAGDAGEAPSRAAGARGAARRREQDALGRRTRARRDQPRSRSRRWARRGSARTSTIACASSRSASRRCASGARTSCRSRGRCWRPRRSGCGGT